jgi:cytochrome c
MWTARIARTFRGKAVRPGPLYLLPSSLAVLCLTVPAALYLAASAAAADLALGEYLSAECTSCHRRDGQDKGIPSIVGWPPQKFVTALNAYKTRQRANPIMQTIAARLTDDDMAALAAFYATLAPAR